MNDPVAPADASKPLTGIESVRQRLRDSARRVSEDVVSEVPRRRMLDAAQMIGTWDWDLAADLVYANTRLAELYSIVPERAWAGVPAGEFLAAIHPDERVAVRRLIEVAIASDAPFKSEYRVLRADGAARWVLAQGRCRYDADGRPLSFPGSVIDITERKETEAEQSRLVDDMRAEKARLQAVLDHVPVGIVFAEAPSGRIVADNLQVERILRHPVLPGADQSAQPGWVAFHENGRIVQPADFPLARAVRGETSGGEDYLYRRGDGTLAWVQLSAAPIHNPDGEIVAGVLSIADIDNERRREKRQAALVALSDRLRDARDPAEIIGIAAEALGRALGASRVGYGTVEADGQHAVIEHDWCDLTAESVAGPHRLEELGPVPAEGLRPGRAYTVEDSVADADGAAGIAAAFARLGIRASAIVPLGAGDGVPRAFLFAHDIAPRRWTAADLALIREVGDRVWSGLERGRALAALHESESRFRAIIESMPQMVWSTTANGEVDYYNQRWYDFTGTARGATDGSNGAHVFHEDDQQNAFERWQYSVRTGELYEIEYRLRRHDGVYRWVLGRAAPMRDADGRPQRWFGTCTDIDDQVRARELLTRGSEELEKQVAIRTAELQTAYERLSAEMTERERTEERLRQSQKMEAVGQLTGGIAHDFNNLMTGVLGSLGQMRKRLGPAASEEIARYLDIAQASADRAASLTHRLLAFSRRQSLDSRAVDVVALVRSMEELLRRTLGENVQLEVADRSATSWPARADENQLENALLNLVINARDAMPHGGRLLIGTADLTVSEAESDDELRAGDYVVLTVSDTGTGMSDDVIARAFDPFFTTKPIGQGTGLGLSMVYGFVRQIGGHVRITSELGRGTEVRLYLPRELAAAAEPAPEPKSAAVCGEREAGGTILVVEDDDGVRALVVELLAELGYTVLEAADGPRGLAIASQPATPIDLLLTDVGLPGMNGRQLAEAIRQYRPQLRVLFMTGYAENAIVRSGFLGSGMSMLTKPFTLDALVADVRRMFAMPVAA